MDPSDRNLRAWEEVQRRRAADAEAELHLPRFVREALPPLAGRHVLHVGCGAGVRTADLIELGALVTGLEESPEALEAARQRAPSALFLSTDPHELPLEVRRGRFDVVLSEGLVREPERWAAGAAAALRPSGLLLHRDEHPAARCLDAALRWREDYFTGPPTLGELVDAIADAGLALERIRELPAPRRRQDPRVPGELLLVARKPSGPR
jgi:SAM-dependent methyltransferase